MKPTLLLLFSLIILIFSCSETPKTQEKQLKTRSLFPVRTTITELKDKDYPDNPDISIRSELDGLYSHKEVIISKKDSFFTFSFIPNNDKSDTLIVSNVDIMEFIPSCPTYIQDDYTKHIGIINQ